MSSRPDFPFLRDLLNNSRVPQHMKDTIVEYHTLPLVYLDKQQADEFVEWRREHYPHTGRTPDAILREFFRLPRLPFNNLLLMYDRPTLVAPFCYTAVTVDYEIENVKATTFLHWDSFGPDGDGLEGFITAEIQRADDVYVMLFSNEYPDAQAMEAAATICAPAALTVAAVFEWAKTTPYHTVTKQPAFNKSAPTKKHMQRKPWKYNSGPQLLFLNQMPSTRKAHQGGTHASPRPHQRRGYYKTLSAPRYRNHPEFGKDHAVFCKPAWIGPEEARIDGNIYRVWKPVPDATQKTNSL